MAFSYKGKPVDAEAIGKELNVRHVLEGSVRRLGEKVEINAQLMSTETGGQVWADRFEGEHGKLGELQLEVVSRLANSLGPELVKAEALRSTRERPGNPDAVDLAMQAQVKWNLLDSKATTNEAVTLSERAMDLDPQNVRALTVLAGASLDLVSDQWSDDPPGDIAHAEKATDAALALQPENSLVHYVRGYLYQVKQQWGPSIAEEETAIALDPNNARAHGLGGLDKMFVGRSEDGLAGVETALRLSPRDPHVPWWQFDMCALQVNLGHYEQAIPWCEKAATGLPQVLLPLLHLAGANALAGHDKEAKDAAAQLLKVYPSFTVQGWASIHWSDDPTFNARYQRVTEGLRKAGLPEGETGELSGRTLAWAERAVSNDPSPPPWYYENLAWACYVGPRYDDALSAMSRYKADFPALYAAICVRLGRLDEARRAIADALKAGTKVSIAKQGSMPQIEPQRAAYLNDLQAAGVPEN